DGRTLNAAGPLLSASGTSAAVPTHITLDGALLRTTNGSTLNITQGPVVQLINTMMTADAVISTDGLGNIQNMTGSATNPTAGAMLDMKNSTLVTRDFFELAGNDSGLLILQPNQPAIRLD